MMANAHNTRSGIKTRTGRWYPVLWRWHFYAGLFCIPFVITLSVSGAVYLFKPQIDDWLFQEYRGLRATPVSETEQAFVNQATTNERIQVAMAYLPGSRFLSYQLPDRPDDGVIINLMHHGEKVRVIVNPWTLSVLNVSKDNDRLIRLVRTFHSELLAGNTGSILVELASCWAIVLIVTGLVMSWARRSGWAGILYIRWRSGRRVLWRDIHSVLGWYFSLLTLFLLITGLPWALVWGSAFKEVRQMTHSMAANQSWSTGRASEKKRWGPMAVETVDLNELVVSRAAGLALAPPVILSVSDVAANTWKAQSRHQNRPLRSDVWINGNDGSVLSMKHFDQKPWIDRVIGVGIAAHEGQLFGWLNQLLGVLTALALVTLSVSGAVLWWRRRPASEGALRTSLGAPPVIPAGFSALGWGVKLTLILLVVFLPMLAVSLIALWLLEILVWSRIQPASRWLGLRS